MCHSVWQMRLPSIAIGVGDEGMKISKNVFGTLSDGRSVYLYTLEAGDLTLSLSTLGAAWTSLMAPSKRQGTDDLLLGYSSFGGYVNNASFFGVTVGRFANRISGAKFSLDGKAEAYTEREGRPFHGT